jgi:hypothetical protein
MLMVAVLTVRAGKSGMIKGRELRPGFEGPGDRKRREEGRSTAG